VLVIDSIGLFHWFAPAGMIPLSHWMFGLIMPLIALSNRLVDTDRLYGSLPLARFSRNDSTISFDLFPNILFPEAISGSFESFCRGGSMVLLVASIGSLRQ